MKKIIFLFATLALSVFAQQNMMYQSVPAEKATILQKGEEKNYCSICGMTLPMFYKTNHAAKHEGHDVQYCSIHCLVEDKEINKKELTDIKVVDNKSLKFIDAKKAFYVVGSSKPGTMSMVSKYAFSKEEDAKAFAKEFGGELKNFDEVYKMVSEKILNEKKMIAKKQAKMAKMGEKIYAENCKKVDVNFTSIAEAKSYVVKNQLCGELKGKKLQAVALYLSGK